METKVFKDFKKINKQDFKKGVLKCIGLGITSIAPLGRSGENHYIYEDLAGKKERGGRCSQVSLRLYGRDVELLITDKEGNFLFYGRYHLSHGVDFIAKEYYKIFNNNKKWILSEAPKRDFVIKENNPTKNIGFHILKGFPCL